MTMELLLNIESIDQPEVEIYHHFYDNATMALFNAPQRGPLGLESVSRIAPPAQVKEYAKRALQRNLPGSDKSKPDIHNAESYWRYIYTEFYEPVINKPYSGYGIYTTPLNLFGVDDDIVGRAVIPYTAIAALVSSGDVVLQTGKTVRLVKDDRDIIKQQEKYTHTDIVKKYHKHKLVFQILPQIVIFNTAQIRIDRIETKTLSQNKKKE